MYKPLVQLKIIQDMKSGKHLEPEKKKRQLTERNTANGILQSPLLIALVVVFDGAKS